ncbi:MAG: acetoin utilization protein AcuC [Armatimonadota bacterium]|nr:acetoin utilization protein AcuC [Armatimonadota bacterium]
MGSSGRRIPFVYSDRLTGYDMGPQHPLKPVRLRMTFELLSEYGVFEHEAAVIVEPEPAAEEDVLQAHRPDYVDAVRPLGNDKTVPDARRYGFGPGDNPLFPGIFEASLLYTGASVTAAREVADGADIAFNISGGLHHALRDRASGFCIFNDPAIAVHSLLHKFKRIAYIDIDAHHGDGVQYAFHDRNDVLTISIHESGQSLFPGTGFAEDIGLGDGIGYSVNLPVAPFTGDEIWLRVFEEIVPPLVESYGPEVIVAQLGADGHFDDPLTHLNLTTAAWLEAVKTILGFGSPVVALGGGGYNLSSVTRMWTLAYATMLGVELSDQIPDRYAQQYGIRRLRDAISPVISASQQRYARDAADETIRTIRRLVFPIHGICP